MKNTAEINKFAWEHAVYEWRVMNQGTPEDFAQKIKKAPRDFLRYHKDYFNNVSGKHVGSICGSDGCRAVALSLLGADAVVFDISEPQKSYALKLAEAAGLKIEYEVGDVCEIDLDKYKGYFDYVYCEGGILHYFHNINIFFTVLHEILGANGILILCDYHPFRKTIAVNNPQRNIEKTNGDYFDNKIYEGHVPYKKFFSEEEQKDFPNCLLRFYTLSDIFKALINAGFSIQNFEKHPKHDDPKFPGEFTIVANKRAAAK